MSDPDEPTPDQETEEEPEPQAEFQHLDSPAFPKHIPGVKEEEQAKLYMWVEGYLVPTWVYEPSARRPWCVKWQEHPDAVSMLHAVFRAFAELIDTEQSGLASPSTWMHHHLLPALTYLRSPDGPFARCVRGPRQIEHALPDAVPKKETT